MSPGWIGCQPSSSRVSALEAGRVSPGRAAGYGQSQTRSSQARSITGR